MLILLFLILPNHENTVLGSFICRTCLCISMWKLEFTPGRRVNETPQLWIMSRVDGPTQRTWVGFNLRLSSLCFREGCRAGDTAGTDLHFLGSSAVAQIYGFLCSFTYKRCVAASDEGQKKCPTDHLHWPRPVDPRPAHSLRLPCPGSSPTQRAKQRQHCTCSLTLQFLRKWYWEEEMKMASR